MNTTSSSNNNSPSFLGNHFVDIHEILPEGEEAKDDQEEAAQFGEEEKRFQRLVKNKKAGKRDFSRQVSLETGFSVLNQESKTNHHIPPKLLRRVETSFGDYGSSRRRGSGGAPAAAEEGRRGDFNLFRTKSTLSRQNTALPRRESVRVDQHIQKNENNQAVSGSGKIQIHDYNDEDSVKRSVPAGRYFAALRGPELDQVKDSEDILLPKDETWPFLLRFPIGCYGISLGLSSQAILWLALSKSPSTKFLHITPFINFVLWHLALGVLIAISVTYAFKSALYFEAVKREYYHPVRINFFFAPWVVCMFLAIGAPPKIAPEELHPAVWCVFIAPILYLDLKIYGQWLSGGKRRLCKVANPSSHLSVVGNFVGAILAAKVGWKEAGKFLWAVGFAHYLVVFVTLYQRLPTSEALPKELHPVYSMFIATPAAASLAWGAVYGEFDGLARTCYFIALFLYLSLVVRPNFFRGFRFSVAWWSYTFPMTTVSIATIRYSEEAPSPVTKGLALALSFMSSTMVATLLVSTLLHAFVWKTLFPNDLAIAITKRRLSRDKKSMKHPWTKQSYLSLASSTGKHNPENKGSDPDT